LQDAQRALKYVRANAERWNIDADKIGIMGSSAGGHLAAMAATTEDDVSAIKDSLDGIYFKPDFTILVSPVIDMSEAYSHLISRKNLLGSNITATLEKKFSAQLHVSKKTPPCFIVVANNDNAVNPINSLLFYQALQQNNIPVSFHAFPQGAHAIALRNNPGSTDLWTSLCEMWLKESGFIKSQSNKN
jgi:acetyl esterase/lipase